MTLKESSIRVLVTDFRGGVGPSAVFLSLYELMQSVDELFFDKSQLKNSKARIDFAGTVNRLRDDREKMIENYSSYKLLFQCLQYYGTKRDIINQKAHEKINKSSNLEGEYVIDE